MQPQVAATTAALAAATPGAGPPGANAGGSKELMQSLLKHVGQLVQQVEYMRRQAQASK